LGFRLPITSDNILHNAIEMTILENLVGALGISIPSCLQAEIHVFLVQHSLSTIELATLENIVGAFGILILLCIHTEIGLHALPVQLRPS